MVHCVFIYRILTQKFISTHIDGVRCVVISRILTQIFISTHINGTFCLYIRNTKQKFISTIIDNTLCLYLQNTAHKFISTLIDNTLCPYFQNTDTEIYQYPYWWYICRVFISRIRTQKRISTYIDGMLCLYVKNTDPEMYHCLFWWYVVSLFPEYRLRKLPLPLLMIHCVFISRVPTQKVISTLIDDTLCLYFRNTDTENYQYTVCVILEY